MNDLTKSQKIRISLTIVWGLVTLLIAGAIAQDYSSFNFVAFLGVLIFFNLPTLSYWLGFWIWGDGYLLKALTWPFRKVARHNKLKDGTGRKIFAGLLAALTFMIILAMLNVIETLPRYVFLSFSERALENVEALTAILVFTIAILMAGKVYRSITVSKSDIDKKNKDTTELSIPTKQKKIGYMVSGICLFLASTMILISANAQGTSAAFLFGETLGSFIIIGLLVLIFTPKRWAKPYQTPILSMVFLVALTHPL